MERNTPRLFIVIPCYNEEKVLPLTAPLFLKKIKDLHDAGLITGDSAVLFVNDGSRDSTWEIIKKLSEEDPRYKGISLSRNRGHQNALLAGLMEAKDQCDITISIDCDGQDDINAMDEMVEAYLAGSDIVYGVRSSRETDSFLKRLSARRPSTTTPITGWSPPGSFGSLQTSRRSTSTSAACSPLWALRARAFITGEMCAWQARATTRSRKCSPSPSTASQASRSSRSGS